MLYVGVDHHKRTSYLTMMDAGGRIVKQANLAYLFTFLGMICC